MSDLYNPPLRVVGFVATKLSDPERGPLARICAADAAVRMLVDGELAWVYGPRRHDLATIRIDETIPRDSVVLRDIAGAAPSELVRIVKVDLDRAQRQKRGQVG